MTMKAMKAKIDEPGGQPVEPVGEVHRVGRAEDQEHRPARTQHDVAPRSMPGES